jgi:hypothetical protein
MTVAALGAATLTPSLAASAAEGRSLKADSVEPNGGRGLTFEIVGQVQNSAPGVSPATSIQYGYLSYLRGLTVFTGVPGESTALLSFYTDAVPTQVATDGPLRVIDRTGTVTFYLNPGGGGSFADPNTFRAGSPLMVSDLRQQVILDTVTNAFTAQNLNTVTSARSFTSANGVLQLGSRGDRFRTVITGHLNTPGPPSAFMAGYTYPISE